MLRFARHVSVGLLTVATIATWPALGVGAHSSTSTSASYEERIIYGCGFPGDICSILPSGRAPQKLVVDPQNFDTAGSISRDGRSIAFAREAPYGSLSYELVVMDWQTRSLRVVTHAAQAPDWSPDSQRLVYNLMRAGTSTSVGIAVINRDGTGFRRLTDKVGDQWPRWSPDGTRIVYDATAGTPHLWSMAPDGTDRRDLGPVGDQSLPAWSPDSRRIAFEAGGEIWTMRRDGTNRVRLTHTAKLDYYPYYSPDGTHIVLTSRRVDDPFGSQLYIMAADGTGRRQLTNNLVDSFNKGGVWGRTIRRTAP